MHYTVQCSYSQKKKKEDKLLPLCSGQWHVTISRWPKSKNKFDRWLQQRSLKRWIDRHLFGNATYRVVLRPFWFVQISCSIFCRPVTSILSTLFHLFRLPRPYQPRFWYNFNSFAHATSLDHIPTYKVVCFDGKIVVHLSVRSISFCFIYENNKICTYWRMVPRER